MSRPYFKTDDQRTAYIDGVFDRINSEKHDRIVQLTNRCGMGPSVELTQKDANELDVWERQQREEFMDYLEGRRPSSDWN